MSKDDNINIKLEICKDKNTGDLIISTIFSQDAPNFSKDKDGYFWWPTIEEKDFLNDAFSLMSGKTPTKSTTTTNSTTDETTTPTPSPKIEDEKLEPEVKVEEDAVFEVTDDKEQKDNEEETPKKEILVAADSHAIDEALKKNKEKKEQGMVEVDEQTIVDKVLSQKKKGKWSKSKD